MKIISLFYRLFSNLIKVDTQTDCWNWQGKPNRDGYGTVRYDNRNWIAHRLAFYLDIGEFPENLLICHKCDNRLCVNPDHLFLGTNQDNQNDRKYKNQIIKYDLQNIKLSYDDMNYLRQSYLIKQISLDKLAHLLNIDIITARYIVQKDLWYYLVENKYNY